MDGSPSGSTVEAKDRKGATVVEMDTGTITFTNMKHNETTNVSKIWNSHAPFPLTGRTRDTSKDTAG